MTIDTAIRNVALAGQASSGDRAVALTFAGGALAAVIDGLGHGRDACLAADAAAEVLSAQPRLPVEELITRCHERLRATRGAVISLASFDVSRATMTWLGVGNVDGVLVRATVDPAADVAIAVRGGTIGFMLPPLLSRTHAVRPGDTLVFTTDGIRHGYKREIAAARSPQDIADAIITHYAKGSDDACVLVARYVGDSDATEIGIDGESDVPQARGRTRDLARKLGFAVADVEALASAVSELAHNMIDHADGGEIVLVPARGPRIGLVVVARDRGPGIADVGLALTDGYTTNGSLGLGLPAARRLVDELELHTELGIGTTVTLRKWLR